MEGDWGVGSAYGYRGAEGMGWGWGGWRLKPGVGDKEIDILKIEW